MTGALVQHVDASGVALLARRAPLGDVGTRSGRATPLAVFGVAAAEATLPKAELAAAGACHALLLTLHWRLRIAVADVVVVATERFRFDAP